MKKIKVLRHSNRARDINLRPTTTSDVASRQVPMRVVRNIRRGHLIRGMRDTSHIEWESWEQKVAEMQRVQERQLHGKANRFHRALEYAQTLVSQVQKREQELQAINEEIDANNEELQATNEEMEATNEELQATSEELRLASQFSRSLIESSLDPMVTIGRNGKITYANSETEAVTGHTREELEGTDFSDYSTDPQHARAGYQKAFKEGAVRDYPLELRHTDGHVTPVMYNASVYRDEAGKVRGVFATARDITEQRKTEQKLKQLLDRLKGSQSQLVQAGKMSAMGTMTAGIAHELNNPLMSILNFVQYGLKHTDKEDKRYAVLEDAARETERCTEIVKNLLTFSRMEQEGEEEYGKESVALICDRVLKLLAYRIEKERVSINRHNAKGTPRIWIKANNIQQVIFNLFSNALESLEKSKKKEIGLDMRRKGGFLQLTVSDTGCGIPPEHLEKIFDPFYTTKPVGKGTGLGLSISHSIVVSHGGEIVCESKVGKGTTFKVLLPLERRKDD